MINFYRFFALIVGLLMVHSSFPQKYFVTSYAIKNGLSTRIVNDVCQDSLGNMWFATYNGISVYDGFSFKNYDVRDGLSKYHYRKVKYMDGMIWGIPYGLADSIACLRNKEWKKIIPASTLSNVEVSSFDLIVINGKTVICLGSSTGLEIYQDNRWNHLNISADPAQNEIISITSAHDRFYVLTKAGVFMVDQDKNGWHAGQIVKPVGEPVFAIKMEQKTPSGEKLWMLSSTRLTYLQNGKFIEYLNGLSVPDPVRLGLSYITFDTSGNIFVGNNLVKYYVDKSSRKVSPLLVRNGFSADGATAICVDREQNVWFTDTRGVDKISCLLLINYFENTGLLENEVTGIVELSDGRLVFGHNCGLTIMDHGKLKQIPFLKSGNIQSRVMDIMQDNNGDVWFTACALGVGKLKKDGTLQWYQVNPSHLAVAIHQDLSGRIWVGTNHALFYFENEKLISHEANSKNVSPFRKIYSNKKGEIIGAGLYGFYTISDTEIKMFPTDDVKLNSFFSYLKSSSGAEYLGSSDGLCMIENGRIRKVNINGSTIDNPVYLVFQDRNQYFWIGSNNGLYRWDGKNNFEYYNVQNGLAGNETNRSAGIVDKNGNIWVGTDMGVSCFLKGFKGIQTVPPKVRLLEMEDRKGTFHSIIEDSFIGFNDNTLLFNFRGVSFVYEDLMVYRYKLEGFDHDWQFVSQSNLDKVKYNSLKPGKYQFSVQAKHGSGEWSAIAKSGIITIETPVYLAWWFYLLIFLFVSLLIFGGVKIFLQIKYAEKLEKEIADRKSSEQKTVQTLKSLHASEVKYRELFEFAVDGILIGSKNGVIIGANSCMQKLTGRTPGNIIGVKIEQLFSNANLSDVPLRYDLLEQGEVVVRNRTILCADGTLIPVEMHTKMLPDGTYQAIFHDITNRMRSDENLRKSRELYQLITDKMTDVVWLLDLKGKSLFVSPSIEQFTGYSINEYLQQTIENRFTPESVAIVKNLFTNVLPTLMAQPGKLPAYNLTQRLEYVCKNGGTKWGELLVTQYLADDGSWLGFHGVTRDVTESKLADDALKEKALELQRFNSLMIGRELKLIELKKEINELLVKANQPEKYIIHE